ncbi:helix-turn-helix domain-containing protein [Kitasatospora sp. NPDC057692]|uniref:helix-turn-helix domain-containing protein n=1 Tax=Kitasatospora sp. NPDC057692 TaxID=3346215 RepID=UPI003680EB1E
MCKHGDIERRNVQVWRRPLSSRVPLHAPATLRWVMRHPGRGAPFSVRALAVEAGCKPATIGHLLSGRYRRTEEETARRIARALGCEPAVLFLLPSSTNLDEPTG